MVPGRFLVFEGIDGAGTTTQVALLQHRLQGLGLPVHRTAEPSTGPVGRLLRQLLAGADAPFDPHAMALLFAADRRDHLSREVLPLLEAGVHVLCDRYALSSIVYQVAAGVPRDFVLAANAGVRQPDMTLLLAVPAEVGAARRRHRDAAQEIYETDATQARVAQAYAEEAHRMQRAGEPVVILDGGGTQEEVALEVSRTLQACLALPTAARS